MQSRHVFITAAIIGALSVTAVAAYAKGASTQDFVRNAAIANEFEIESSKVALDKSQNDGVKEFAQRMVDDHTDAGQKFKKALQSAKTQVSPPTSLDDRHQRLLNRLKSLSGKRFDQQYVSAQTDAHKEAVDLFSGYAQHGKDPALKEFAAQTLPTLQDHLKHVQQLSVQ